MAGVRALWYSRGVLHLVDQRKLPGRFVVRPLRTVGSVATAIRNMTVRGAPSIGAAAAFGMALAARSGGWTPDRAARLLRATRPTAHDLFVGVETVRAAWARGEDPEASASAYCARIVEECHAIGRAGAPLVRPDARVLTHCNAGALATVAWGTALAPIRVAHLEGRKPFVWVDETRPLLQGARLTAWELAREHIAHAVIADNAAGHFFRLGEVDAVIVGADRIVANGDFANKIGTYEKALLAREHAVPFYVAAPWSTFDLDLTEGGEIPVEERAGAEVAGIGRRRTTPRSSPIRNPAFDVTPGEWVAKYLTPAGALSRTAALRAAAAARRGRRTPA